MQQQSDLVIKTTIDKHAVQATISGACLVLLFIGVAVFNLANPPEPQVSLGQLKMNKKIALGIEGFKVVAVVPKLRGVHATIYITHDGSDLPSPEIVWKCDKTEFARPDWIGSHTLQWQPDQEGIYYASLVIHKEDQRCILECKQALEITKGDIYRAFLSHLLW